MVKTIASYAIAKGSIPFTGIILNSDIIYYYYYIIKLALSSNG